MDYVKAGVLANKILKQNSYSYLAWEMKALDSANQWEWNTAIEYQTNVIKIDRYNKEGYESLLAYLQKAALDAVQKGDTELAKEYVKQMKEVPQIMLQVLDKTSFLGRKIKEQGIYR